MPAKPKAPKVKEPKVDEFIAKIPAGKKPTKANATKALDALEVVKGEPADNALKRRGLKLR